jgi:hypothetical protein
MCEQHDSKEEKGTWMKYASETRNPHIHTVLRMGTRATCTRRATAAKTFARHFLTVPIPAPHLARSVAIYAYTINNAVAVGNSTPVRQPLKFALTSQWNVASEVFAVNPTDQYLARHNTHTPEHGLQLPAAYLHNRTQAQC